MRKYLLLFVVITAVFACKDKKKSLTGTTTVEVGDFFGGFETLKLPYSVADTNINKLIDTSTITQAVFNKFVPDTLLSSAFNKEKNLVIHPVGRFENKGKETYLVTHVRSKNKSAIYLLVFDNNKKFSSSLPLLTTNPDKEIVYSSTIDNRLAISLTKEWKQENDLLYSRVIYAYNNVGVFTVVMTETNDQSHLATNINNPLDTLPKTNKYSGDYIKGKRSFLFLRDGKNPSTYRFYVRFENDDEEPCTGELKGEIVMQTDNSAVFSENGDPCVVDFSFSKNQVKVKEQGSCGNHRGIKCFFDDTYTKKKEPKPKK
ncbi:MAG TPA: hypothetical protein VF622_18035 [Segetibacter sp.]|jgi:hypothetical protein